MAHRSGSLFSVAFAILVSAALLTTAGCGDNHVPSAPDAGGDDPGLDEHGCRILTLGKPVMHVNPFGTITGLHYEVSPNLGGERPDYFLVELYDSSTGEDIPPLATGTYDLGAAPDNDLFTCQHCVWLNVDPYLDNTNTLQPYALTYDLYYATTGSMTLDFVQDPLALFFRDAVFAGSTSHVDLYRAELTEDGRTVLEPGGDCVAIRGVTFDTSPTPGAPCESAEDCGDPTQLACDPVSHTCATPTCNFDEPCADPGQICVQQFYNQFNGMCYVECDPLAATTSCGPTQTCQQYGIYEHRGYCKENGDTALGGACEPEDNTTSCVAGAACSLVTKTCTNTCDFYNAVTGCAAGTLCTVYGVCELPAGGADVAVGGTCPASASEATACGPDDQGFRGICFGGNPYELDVVRACERACFGPEHCAADQYCALRYTSGQGICLPVPVCGDGALGEINELCDDGNVVSGDGCSSDCQPEYAVLCNGLPALPIGTQITGDTSTGVDGFFSSCQFATASAKLYQLTPPGPGQLTLHLESPTFHTISVRTDCTDATSERACAVGQANEGTDEILQLTSASPVTVMVSALTVFDEGSFKLTATFAPETCGDGAITGAEVCDDGNAVGGDGCSADCHAHEYGALCLLAPVLSTTALTIGDTTSSLNRFESSCADPITKSGRDNLYTFVAPATGTLHVSLNDMGNLLTLTVFDGCGAPGTRPELACVVDPPEELDIALLAGQQISIVVDGFQPDWLGAYELAATFTPDPN